MEEGKKRLISSTTLTGTNNNNVSTNNTASGKPIRRMTQNNLAHMTAKYKHSKNSPQKQAVTLAHPMSMLRSHKQVSTTSFDATNHDMSVVFAQAAIGASPLRSTTNQQKLSQMAQAAKHHNPGSSPLASSQTFSSKTPMLLMAASKLQASAAGGQQQTQDHKHPPLSVSTTAAGQSSIRKPMTSPPVDQKGVAKTLQVVTQSSSSVVLLSNKHQKQKTPMQHHETPSKASTGVQRNSNSGVAANASLSSSNITTQQQKHQIKIDTIGRQVSGKDENVPSSATKLEIQHNTSSFSWYVKQKNQNMDTIAAETRQPQPAVSARNNDNHKFASSQRFSLAASSPQTAKHKPLRKMATQGFSEQEGPQQPGSIGGAGAVSGCDDSSQLSVSSVSVRRENMRALPKGNEKTAMQASPGKKIQTFGRHSLGVGGGSNSNCGKTAPSAGRPSGKKPLNAVYPTSQLSLSQQQTLMTNNSAMTPTSGIGKSLVMISATQCQTARPVGQNGQIQSKTLQHRLRTNLASGAATSASVNKAAIDETNNPVPTIEPIAERIQRRKSMLQTSHGSASFNNVIPELNNVVCAVTSKRKENNQTIVPSERNRSDSTLKERMQSSPTKKRYGKVLPPSQNCKRQKDIGDGFVKPKGVKKAYIQVSSTKPSQRNPEETPVAAMKQDTSRDINNKSQTQLFKAKNLMLAKKQTQQTTVINSVTRSIATSSLPSVSQSSTVNQKRANSFLRQKGSVKQKACASTSSVMKKRTMAEMHALTSSQKYGTAVGGNSRNAQKSTAHQNTVKLENIEREEEPPKRLQSRSTPPKLLCLDQLDESMKSSSSDESHVFHTQDRSPISIVPKVQICLRSFPQTDVIEESKISESSSNPYTDSTAIKKKTKVQLPQKNSMNEDSSVSGTACFQNMLIIDQSSYKNSSSQLPDGLAQTAGADDSGISQHNLLYSQHLRLSDPFQQGGGSTTRDGQTGGDNEMISVADLDSSFIPAEDVGTQKVDNMQKLGQSSSKSLNKPHLITPKSLKKSVIGSVPMSQRLQLHHKKVTSMNSSPKVDNTTPAADSSSLTTSQYNNQSLLSSYVPQRHVNLAFPSGNTAANDSSNLALRSMPYSAQNAKAKNFTFNSHLRNSGNVGDGSGSNNFKNAYQDEELSEQNLHVIKRSSSNLVSNIYQTKKPGQVQSPPASLSKKRSFQQTRNNPMLPSKAMTLNGLRSSDKTNNRICFNSMEASTIKKLQQMHHHQSSKLVEQEAERRKSLQLEVQSAHTRIQVNKTEISMLPMTELKAERDVGNQSSTNQDEATSMRMSLGLGQLLESAKSFKNTNLNNFNPMFESIKKSFQSILGSSQAAPAGNENLSSMYSLPLQRNEQSIGEETKSITAAQVVVEDDFRIATQQKSHKKLKINEALMSTAEKTKLNHRKKPPAQPLARQLFSHTDPHAREASKLRSATIIKKSQSNEQVKNSSKQSPDLEKVPPLPNMFKMKSQPKAQPTQPTVVQQSPVISSMAEPGSRDHRNADGALKITTTNGTRNTQKPSSPGSPGSGGTKRRAGTIIQKFSTHKSQTVELGCNPMGSPSDCLLQFGHLLNPEEKLEILSYQEVWFVGTTQAKSVRKTYQLRNREKFRGHSSRSPNRTMTSSGGAAAAHGNTASVTRKQSQSLSRGSQGLGLLNALYGGNNASKGGGASQHQQATANGLSRRRGVPFSHNHGYDTQAGFYQTVNGDHLAYRYETLEELGRGTFGQVIKCRDHKTGDFVAIKMSKNLNQAGLDNCQREVRLLKHANSVQTEFKGRIVGLLDEFKFRHHLCLVFELLGSNDLYKEIKQSQMTGLAQISQIKLIVEQILQGLCHLKECGIVHCDLKPENVIYTSDAKTDVKIVDLGSASSKQEKGFTYVCSRYYRAPEMVLSRKADYTCAVDMWSLGCITAELYNGLPLFLASSQNELIEYQSLYCGGFDREDVLRYNDYEPYLDLNTPSGIPVPIPDPKPVYKAVKPKVISSVIKEVLCRKKRPGTPGEVLDLSLSDEEVLNRVSQDERLMIDFIDNCLQLRPEERITCENAL